VRQWEGAWLDQQDVDWREWALKIGRQSGWLSSEEFTGGKYLFYGRNGGKNGCFRLVKDARG